MGNEAVLKRLDRLENMIRVLITRIQNTTGAVSSVFGRTGAVVAASNDYTWAQVDKTTSDIADITTKAHTSLSSIGTNTHAQIDTHIADTTDAHTVSSDTLTFTNKSMSEAQLTFTDITTGNASTTAHGFLKKLDNTATNFMNGQGNWAAPAGGSATKEFFYKAPDQDSTLDGFRVDLVAATASAFFSFILPNDFTSLTNCMLVMIPDATETVQADFVISAVAVGEDYNLNTATNLNQTKAVTVTDITEWDIAGLFPASLAANDYIGIAITSDTTQLRIVGMRIKYA